MKKIYFIGTILIIVSSNIHLAHTNFDLLDSCNTADITENLVNGSENKVLATDILLQLGAGIGGGVLTAIPGALIGRAISSPNKTMTGGLSGMYIGYVLGNAIGVNIAADNDKYSSSFPLLLISSVTAGATGLLIFSASDQKGPLSGAPLYLPPIISVLMLNIFNKGDFNEENVSILLNCIRKQNGVDYSLHISYQL